jgi:hypothetical protein
MPPESTWPFVAAPEGDPPRLLGDGGVHGLDVADLVEVAVHLDAVDVEGVGLDGDHAAVAADRGGQHQRVHALVGAEVEDGGAGPGLVPG